MNEVIFKGLLEFCEKFEKSSECCLEDMSPILELEPVARIKKFYMFDILKESTSEIPVDKDDEIHSDW